MNRPAAPKSPPEAEGYIAPRWSRVDAIIVAALLLPAIATRFLHLGTPDAIVFDEKYTVGIARAFLHRLPFRNTHPPLPGLLIALSIRILGDQPWSWRLPGAALGTALVCITYLLGRRMFNSRLAGSLASIFVLCDGLFLVESRIALWEIFYLTFAAQAYLLLFRFAQSSNRSLQRRIVAVIGVALGLSLASKLLIPVITAALVSVFLILLAAQNDFLRKSPTTNYAPLPQMAAILALVGGTSAIVYMAFFLPNYWLGFWHGITDQLVYYSGEVHGQMAMTVGPRHHYDLSWWTWLLSQQPVIYWPDPGTLIDLDSGGVAIIALSNPVIIRGVTVAIPIVAIQAINRRSLPRAFLAVGYAAYVAMWALNPRFKFLYHYMPALYLGFLAPALVLTECWQGLARRWQEMVMLAPMLLALIGGLGIRPAILIGVVVAAVYFELLRRYDGMAGKLTCAIVIVGALCAFSYYLPVWSGMPLSPAALRARMWVKVATPAGWDGSGR